MPGVAPTLKLRHCSCPQQHSESQRSRRQRSIFQPWSSSSPHDMLVLWRLRVKSEPLTDISLNLTHGTTLFRKVLFDAVLVETRACCLAMYATLATHGTPFQDYPALCHCEPRRPLGDMQALSCGARSRQYSRLLPPARNLDVSSRKQAQGPWVGFIYIYT